MPVTQAAAITKVRLRLQDKTTRRDGSSVTNPRFSDSDVSQALNDVIRDSVQEEIAILDKTWYRSTQDYTGVSSAVASSGVPATNPSVNDIYNLPTNFKQWEDLRRTDLPFFPIVPLIDYNYQDANKFLFASLWSGFYAAHPENVAPAGATASIINTTQWRVIPAPVTTAQTFRLFYQRTPTEPATTGSNLDVPDPWIEVVAFATAFYLAAAVNDETAPMLEKQLARALQARQRDYHGRDASRAIFGAVRFGGQVRFSWLIPIGLSLLSLCGAI